MFKSIIKEIFIIVLLVIAILLILGILFYEYRPSTKKIPTAVAEYTLPQDMQEELDETIDSIGTQNIVQTYRVDSHDLDGYERSKDYEKGKPNPFSAVKTSEDMTDTDNSNSVNTQNSTNTNQKPSNGTGIQGSFLNTVK